MDSKLRLDVELEWFDCWIIWYKNFFGWVTTHHDPTPSTTSQNISTNQPPPVKIYSPPPTTSQNISTATHQQPKYIHHHLPPAKIYPPPLTITTTSQNISTTTYYHPPPAKIYSPPTSTTQVKIYSYINFRH